MEKDSLDEATLVLKSCSQAKVWIEQNNFVGREETWNALTNIEWLFLHLSETSLTTEEKDYFFDSIELIIALLVPEHQEVEHILNDIAILRDNKDQNDFESYINLIKENKTLNNKIKMLLQQYLVNLKYFCGTNKHLKDKKDNFSILSNIFKNVLSEDVIANKFKERYSWAEINRRFQNKKLNNI